MASGTGPIEELIDLFSRLPGIGRKSAARMTYHLLVRDTPPVEELARALRDLRTRVRRCSVCGNFTEVDPCSICSGGNRDTSVICAVEHPQDVQSIEAAGDYRGLYHVLDGTISPLDGIGPGDLRIAELIRRAEDPAVTEVILATNPTVDGDTTAIYIARQLQQIGKRSSRLALGLPVGGDLEYADRQTLARSFRARTRMETE